MLPSLNTRNGNNLSSAQLLLGVQLPGGWTVVERLQPPNGATGGNFSTGYIVQSTGGDRAFLKAIDFSRALRSPDPARALQALTAAFNFERDVLAKCKARQLDRVAVALDRHFAVHV
jgi:eukaryotic-like serine/threonine-protein kinase